MLRRSTLIAVLALAPVALAENAPELSDATFERWRDFIAPKPGELSFRQIPWRARLWDAVVDAQAQEKPIVLWAMNGHPLGCT